MVAVSEPNKTTILSNKNQYNPIPITFQWYKTSDGAWMAIFDVIMFASQCYFA